MHMRVVKVYDKLLVFQRSHTRNRIRAYCDFVLFLKFLLVYVSCRLCKILVIFFGRL